MKPNWTEIIEFIVTIIMAGSLGYLIHPKCKDCNEVNKTSTHEIATKINATDNPDSLRAFTDSILSR